ncbi:putative MFS family arabinose efflux permease [Antricoccus suffuscus]|uniref:Putative MFS family arabinose efflux permease n=1 Tax=Antricoccus suffuscus TaxID=1629062 RepID=A0A2T1A141_9ACTN|nr:putative MFS family arabinose efflux permease [Antricoccus suffuscus]
MLAATTAMVIAMGVGRFAYTPILPLMHGQTDLDAQGAAALATANYLGYLVGAVAAIFVTTLATRTVVLRTTALLLVASLALMPVSESVPLWWILRFVAGVMSAIIFVYAVRVAHQELSGTRNGPGWVFGGVGVGIALSGICVLSLGSTGSWITAWLMMAVLAAVGTVIAWWLPGGRTPKAALADATDVSDVDEARAGKKTVAVVQDDSFPVDRRRRFVWLCLSYFLEGVGYIVAGTFIVAALSTPALPSWLGSGAWILVGLAIFPSCVFWNWMSKKVARPWLLVTALSIQTVGVALPALSAAPAAALLAAVLFGGTFVGIASMSLAEGAALIGARAAAILTALYGVGQVLGPIVVTPLLSTGPDTYARALEVGAMVVAVGALCAVPVGRAVRRRSAAER